VSQGALADRLHSAAIHLLRQVAAVDARSGLSAARLSALSVVVYAGPLTMSELARAEQVSNPTISSTVSGLESAGLVARTRPAGDARSVQVTATPAGRELVENARAARLAVLDEALSRLTATDRAALAAAVDPLERLAHQPPC
jgi:DNA-binding MarR family transcriptional regulator